MLGPILAGVLLDLVDLATYGPIGLWTGAIVGGLTGYLLAMSLGVEASRRWPYAALAGAYCTMPFTAFLPLATMLGAVIRFREHGRPGPPPEGEPAAIEAEYRSRWDDG